MKNIIITGTSRGIGYELALQFAKEGHQVLAISRKTRHELIQNSNITCLSIDISDENQLLQVESFIKTAWQNKVDILINNAGLLISKPFEQLSTSDFEQVYKVNVFAVAELTRICIPFLEKGSHVVTISSMGGIQGSSKFAGLAAYSSSKGAVITLSELLAEEYKEKGIAFNVLALGAVNTENGLVINRNDFLKTLSITQTVLENNKVEIHYADLQLKKEFSTAFITV